MLAPTIPYVPPDVSSGGGFELNKFEQVSSDGHQMSLAGGPCPVRSSIGEGGSRDGGLYNEVQYIMANGYMGTTPDTTENITFPNFVCWQTVMNNNKDEK